MTSMVMPGKLPNETELAAPGAAFRGNRRGRGRRRVLRRCANMALAGALTLIGDEPAARPTIRTSLSKLSLPRKMPPRRCPPLLAHEWFEQHGVERIVAVVAWPMCQPYVHLEPVAN